MTRRGAAHRQAPGPPRRGFLGHLRDFERDPLATVANGFRRYGDVCRFHLGPIPAFLLARPEHVEHVLLRHHSRYDRKDRTHEVVEALIGKGLLTNDGKAWQQERRLIQPAFQHRRMTAFAPMMTRLAEETASGWSMAAAQGRFVDVHDDMVELTLGVIGEFLAGTDLRPGVQAVERALDVFSRTFDERLYNAFAAPEWMPTGLNLELRREQAGLARMVRDLITARRHARGQHEDLLSMMLAAREEEGAVRVTDQRLCEAFLNILIPAQLTTASALAFIFYLLGRHPAAAHRLRDELARTLGGCPPTVADLPHLYFTKQLIEESMRLYPPVWMIVRRAAEDDVVDGFLITEGNLVLLSPFVTHQHPELWEDPERFDPDRFSPKRSRERHRFAYYPFGGGPRTCIGAKFAMLEMQLVLAILAQRFELISLPSSSLELDAGSSLRPRSGLRMKPREVSPIRS